MKRFGSMLAFVTTIVGVALIAQGHCGSCDASQEKTCASKTACGDKTACGEKAASGQCAGSAKACADEGACCAKDGCPKTTAGEIAAKTTPDDCAGCAPMANWAKSHNDLQVDTVRVDGGIAVIFTTSRADLVADLQRTVGTVNRNVTRAVTSSGTTEGLCTQCTDLIALAKSGVKVKTETISAGALVLLTSPDATTVRSLHAWADGLKKSATAMRATPPQTG
jgi:hypothetical protein